MKYMDIRIYIYTYIWMLEIVSKKSRHLTSIPDPIPHLCKKDDHLELGRGVLHELAHLKNCNC